MSFCERLLYYNSYIQAIVNILVISMLPCCQKFVTDANKHLLDQLPKLYVIKQIQTSKCAFPNPFIPSFYHTSVSLTPLQTPINFLTLPITKGAMIKTKTVWRREAKALDTITLEQSSFLIPHTWSYRVNSVSGRSDVMS